MKILFIGDVFAKAGRRAIRLELKKLIDTHQIDLIIANVENCTHGRGISLKHYDLLKQSGVNYFTFGNHTWDHDDIQELLKTKTDLIRPLNVPNINPYDLGCGSILLTHKNKQIRITSLLGRSITMRRFKQTNPFIELENIIQTNNSHDIHIIDFHSETTSEKNTFLQAFNGRVSAIIGTHTHVQTADEKIFNNTAYITDVGMTGPAYGVIGAKPQEIIAVAFEKQERFHIEPAHTKYQFNAVILEFNDSNKPTKIQRICNYES